MNHRLIQRTLFRMQMDAAFRDRVLAGEGVPGLREEEAALLRRLDPAAISADRHDRRRSQTVGNILKEFVLTWGYATRVAAGHDLDVGFLGSDEFHRAVTLDERLPLAFARYAERVSVATTDGVFRALVALDCALVRARRAAPGARGPAAPGQVRLATTVHLLVVPDGTLAYAATLRQGLDAGEAPRPPAALARTGEEETLLLNRAPIAPRFRLPEVAVERLEAAVAELLHRAAAGFGPRERGAFADSWGVPAADLESFVDELVADGVVERG